LSLSYIIFVSIVLTYSNNHLSELRKKQKHNSKIDYLIQVADDVLLSASAYDDLISGNIITFTKLLKRTLLTRSQISLSSANEPVFQAIVEFLLPSKYRVPELCLIMNSSKKKGEGRFGFVDVFILGEDIKRNYVNQMKILFKYVNTIEAKIMQLKRKI
jgi:hypothetical protein